jgi:predicted ATP-dependent endonuclease of OLD family
MELSMQIESIKIMGFKCFKEVTLINLNGLTCLIGANATGKSTALEALAKMFSINNQERNIQPSDFHVPANETLESQEQRELFIEVKIILPELQDETEDDRSIAATFKHMVITNEGALPFCIIRLDARWHNTNSINGDIDQTMNWIISNDGEESITHRFTSVDRSRIHVHYIPALRDPIKQLKHSAGTIMKTFFQAVQWSEGFKENLNSMADSLNTFFQDENGVKTIQENLSNAWKEFYNQAAFQEVSIKPITNNLDDFLNKIETIFSPTPTGGESGINRLSDGLRSLFYFTLIKTLIEIQAISESDTSFNHSKAAPPLLTILAIEEPENHMAPHYLGKITNIFRNIANQQKSQIILTSHSPAILKRIDPAEVRYMRIEESASVVSEIKLPDSDDDVYKYVKDAIKVYPEIYFAKCVIFGEGESEMIVLPKLLEALEVKIDESFLSIVPLGGRHVNHLWKLCHSLNIPHLTLLDYDNYRGGGDWGRIKYVVKQLIENGCDKDSLLGCSDGSVLSDEQLDDMSKWEKDEEEEKTWREFLEQYNVFFSFPYDLDFMMLQSFTDMYTEIETYQNGPRIPKTDSDKYNDECIKAIAAVRKKDKSDVSESDISQTTIDYYFWYKYLFLGQGKPITHLKTLAKISPDELSSLCPDVITRLSETLKEMIKES